MWQQWGSQEWLPHKRQDSGSFSFESSLCQLFLDARWQPCISNV
ncbi:hypothetical protein SBA4_750002 [Candidatus Sulfopaludibacter sp. SbA4]|nr:hypothetical protein SBA4_750002 [Candidatus Sulfopaludibacter sp. SbA4]